eukprot:12540699-Ditylum_brightwellii.AAC.1
MLAAKHGQSILSSSSSSSLPVSIVSVEMSSAMSRLANQTVSSNSLQDVITTVGDVHSADASFHPFPDSNKANICTSELLESGLLGEGVLPAMRDAWERHLSQDAIVVPRKARVYAMIVEGKNSVNGYVAPIQFPLNKENKEKAKKERGGMVRFCTASSSSEKKNISDVLLGYGELSHATLLDKAEQEDESQIEETTKRRGEGIRVPLHAEKMFAPHCSREKIEDKNNNKNNGNGKNKINNGNSGDARILSNPTLVLEFDFTSSSSIPPPQGRTISNIITPTSSGIAHGVLFWWELDLSDNDNNEVKTSKRYYSTGIDTN